MFPSKLNGHGDATITGLLTAAGVYLIYQNALPSVTEIRASAPANDDDTERSRRMAAIESAVLISAVFLIARDVNSYIISGLALVGIDYMHKHANGIAPSTGQLVGDDTGTIAPGMQSDSDGFSLPDYTDDSIDS